MLYDKNQIREKKTYLVFYVSGLARTRKPAQLTGTKSGLVSSSLLQHERKQIEQKLHRTRPTTTASRHNCDKTAVSKISPKTPGTRQRMTISSTWKTFHQELNCSLNGTANERKETKNTFSIPKMTMDVKEMVSTTFAIPSRNGWVKA